MGSLPSCLQPLPSSSLPPFTPAQPSLVLDPSPLTTAAGVRALDLPPELLPFIISHLPFCSLQGRKERGHQGLGRDTLLCILNMGQALVLLSSQTETRQWESMSAWPGPAPSEVSIDHKRERQAERQGKKKL